ncbi:mannosylfructose-phosphate synthase [Variibacter gotjawalensis]|uniref:Mannosylfructose-phosphate synthase n=1 Tax=Variibacter gotjawalensis TaxID=1333996 RepID=A0A0S3PV71_9BRAD|nr:glycosyltransferase [Variibacter gotjawalensis]NIK50121.1 glycosyltransferase involved in cell wall biosynthesis [Variibacter gotjawalensis]RZS46118.1 glycosyltransferase involved in cell wall biosynthesis [Variibacter gotjawalensis]BAT59794.1 mannosylfructose-phosphate synthase [Variibacter gotjawalensis]
MERKSLVSIEQADQTAAHGLAGASVLQVVPALLDDATGRAAFDLAMASLRAGSRALVASGPGPLVGELQASGGEWSRLDFSKSGMMARRRNVQALEEVIRNERIAVMHAYGTIAAACAIGAGKRAKIPVVTSYHQHPNGEIVRGDPQAQGDRVIAPSQYSADIIARQHNIDPQKIVVIPPMVDTYWFDPAYVTHDRVAAVRDSWRVRPEARVVLLPGRLVESEGHFELVDAVRILLNGGMRGVVFVIAGDAGTESDYLAALEHQITVQGVAPIIRLVGRSGDMAAAYLASDVVVLPSDRADVFSARAAEAQAMGCPVVITDVGANAELIDASDTHNRTGWLTAPHDSISLARGIAGAISLDARARQQLAGNAREFTLGRFSPEHVTGATLAVYEQLLQGSR